MRRMLREFIKLALSEDAASSLPTSPWSSMRGQPTDVPTDQAKLRPDNMAYDDDPDNVWGELDEWWGEPTLPAPYGIDTVNGNKNNIRNYGSRLPGIDARDNLDPTRQSSDDNYGIAEDQYMLDEPGTIVEPDVRKSIKKYMKSMDLYDEKKKRSR
jgi:hypothetical protein